MNKLQRPFEDGRILLKIVEGSLDFIPELVDVLVKVGVNVYDPLDLNILICLLSLDVTLPILIELFLMQILTVSIADRSYRPIDYFLQLFNEYVLGRREFNLVILLTNFDIDPCVIAESLFVVLDE